MAVITLENSDRGNIATAERNQIRNITPCAHLGFRLCLVFIFNIASSLSILMAASVVLVTMPLTLMKYRIKWQAAEPSFHALVHLTVITKGTVLTNKRSARKRFMVKLVVFASCLSWKTRTSAPMLPTTEIKKRISRTMVSINGTNKYEWCSSEKKEKWEKFCPRRWDVGSIWSNIVPQWHMDYVSRTGIFCKVNLFASFLLV